MPQSKKRKKPSHSCKPIKTYMHLSKHYIDEFERVAYQIMKMADIDSSDYESLTKRTRHELMMVKWTPFRVYAEAGFKVPKVYIKFYNEMMSRHETATFYGDEKFKVSYLDYVTYGMSFIFALRNYDGHVKTTDENQLEVLKQMREAIIQHTNANQSEHYLVRTNYVMKILSMYLSSPIYRYYNSRDDMQIDYSKGRAQNLIWISTIQPTTKVFKIQNEKHKGYQLWRYDMLSDTNYPNPIETEVPMLMLEGDEFDAALQKLSEVEDKQWMPVYVQGHVIHRMRQRLDCMDNFYINMVLSTTFMAPQTGITINGQLLLKAFDHEGNHLGYFPFIVQEKSVLLLSFLPLSSPITPEGSKLYKLLDIKMNDSKYIGLDKLSFYIQTDFEKLTNLKDALQEANMWHLTEITPSDKMEKREDRLLERFFGESKR